MNDILKILSVDLVKKNKENNGKKTLLINGQKI